MRGFVRRFLSQRIGYLVFIAFMGCSELARGQSVTLSVGSGSGIAGGSVVVPITLTSSGGAQAAAVQWSLSYSSDITGITFAAGIAATNAGKSIECNGNLCLVYGLNTTVISDGIVATVTLQISSNPSIFTIPIQITGVVAATPEADSIPAEGISGTVSVLHSARVERTCMLRYHLEYTGEYTMHGFPNLTRTGRRIRGHACEQQRKLNGAFHCNGECGPDYHQLHCDCHSGKSPIRPPRSPPARRPQLCPLR